MLEAMLVHLPRRAGVVVVTVTITITITITGTVVPGESG